MSGNTFGKIFKVTDALSPRTEGPDVPMRGADAGRCVSKDAGNKVTTIMEVDDVDICRTILDLLSAV